MTTIQTAQVRAIADTIKTSLDSIGVKGIEAEYVLNDLRDALLAHGSTAAPQQAVAASSESPDAGQPLLQKLIDSIENYKGVACWSYSAMYDVRDALLASTNQPVQAKALTDVFVHCWQMYKTGQISADHTDKQVFIGVLQSFSNWLQTSQPSAQADVAAVRDALELAARRVEADCIGFAKEDAQLLKIIADIRAMKSAAPTAQPQADGVKL